MDFRVFVTATLLGSMVLGVAAMPARADRDREGGRGWHDERRREAYREHGGREHEWRDEHWREERRRYGVPPVFYQGPRSYYAPPPVIYRAPGW